MQNYPWKENQVMVIDPQFFQDCESLLTNKKCHSVLAKLFEQIKNKGLLSGNNFELIKSSGKFNLYSIRINITDRLLLTTHNDYCCLVAIVANHDYDKNKYVRNPCSLDKLTQNFPKENDFQLKSEQDMTHLFEIVNKYAPSAFSPVKPKFRPIICASPQFFDDDEKNDVEDERSDIEVAEILGQHLVSDEIFSAYESFRGSLTPVQSRFMEIKSPKILQGCKGSGKTTALLGEMVNYVVSNPSSKLLYLHQSPTRLSQAKAQWELISNGDNQHVQFSTVDNLLQAKIKIDEKQFLLFQQWLKFKLGEYGFSRVVNSEDIFKELLTLEEMGRTSDAFDEDDLQTILKIEQDFKSYLFQHSYDLIVVDDAEKLELGQLQQIHQLTHERKACFAFNQHNMSMSVEKQIFLKTLRISPSAFNEVRLEGTFQYSNAVIEVMNHLLYLKRTMTDGKTETFSRASESPELIGEKDMLDAKQQDKLITYQALVANEQFVVVCHEQHIEKAKALFQTEEVYSYEQFQDKSAEGIILFNPLSEPGAVELNTKLKNIGTEKLDRSEYLDKLILSIQNAKKNIVLYQDFESDKENHLVEKLFEYLSDGFGTKTEVEQVTQFSSALASQDKINSPLVVFSKPKFKPSPAGQKIIELIDNFNLENFIEFLEKNPKLDRVFFLPLNDEQNNLCHFLLANTHHLQEYFKLMLSSNQILLAAPLKRYA